MRVTDDQLKELQTQLDALRQIKVQEDYDEGARLHAEKNAPWVNGMYSHLKFPAYVFKEYPRAMYRYDYAVKKAAYDTACAMLVSGNDLTRELAIREATREIDPCVKHVETEGEMLALGPLWGRTPDESKAIALRMEQEIAVEAAHLNYDDRNLTGPALAERERADELSDGHLVDVTATLKSAKARKRAEG